MSNTQMKLAALAVFKSLYDSKKDVDSVLWEFTENSLGRIKIFEFTEEELRSILVTDYGFDNIPLAVVRTMLRKHNDKELLYLRNGQYMIFPETRRRIESADHNTEMEDESERFGRVVSELTAFICENREEEISTERVMNALQSFLLDEFIVGDLTSEINAYILKKEQENATEFRDILNQIKEGFILYSEICR